MTTIYIRVLDQGVNKEIKNGQLTEQRTLVALIPMQPGFEAEMSEAAPITTGDQLLFSGRWYSCDDIKPDSYGAVYRCNFSECKRLSEGVQKL
jgi:hypothetical protein